jgi:hypothetical protein
MIMAVDILRNWREHFLNHDSELELVVWGSVHLFASF